MREELEAECVRSIERGSVDDSLRFSRRHRWKTLALDVHGDDAVVLVARRGKRVGGEISAREYRRRRDGWEWIGAGGGGGEGRTLPPRPAAGERWFRPVSSGVVDPRGRGFLSHGGLGHLEFQVAEGVSQVQWRGRRRAVAAHGFVCVVWRGRSMPAVELFDEQGDRVDLIGWRDARSVFREMPWRVRVRYALTRRFHRDEWFNYAPRGS